MSSERGPLGPIGVLAPLESNSEIDSTSHYRESTALQYLICITTRHQVLGFMTYYPLYVNSPWTGFNNLTRYFYNKSKLPLKSLSYISHFLCDQMTYSSSKERMSNFTKGITMAIDFMITCPLDNPRGHTISIPWDIMVPLMRIHVATSLHQ